MPEMPPRSSPILLCASLALAVCCLLLVSSPAPVPAQPEKQVPTFTRPESVFVLANDRELWIFLQFYSRARVPMKSGSRSYFPMVGAEQYVVGFDGKKWLRAQKVAKGA